MTPFAKGLIHTIAGMAGVSMSFAWIPSPYTIYVAAIWAGIVTTSAFLDQSLSK